MEITVSVIIFVILGIIISRLSKLVGSQIFKFSDIYKFFSNFLKTKDK